MKSVRFWGTRGSLPVALTAAALRPKLLAALRGARGLALASDADLERYVDSLPFATAGTYGGHSACVQIELGGELGGDRSGSEFVVCDMGSGLRPFGHAALSRRVAGEAQTFHIFQSHLHWDHIMGLPFFVPAYIPGNRVIFYGGHAGLEAALRRQQAQPSFPVDFSIFGAELSFVQLEPGRVHEAAGMRVHTLLQRHGGDSYGYRFEHEGKSVL
jgi:phosphoribosyl 1,2-cyclic phosphodiesterase